LRRWEKRSSREALGLNDRTDPMAELIAKKIIELAQRGLRNPTALSLASVEAMCDEAVGPSSWPMKCETSTGGACWASTRADCLPRKLTLLLALAAERRGNEVDPQQISAQCYEHCAREDRPKINGPGPKQTSWSRGRISAFEGKADMEGSDNHAYRR
jgi:hypothetical protein